MRLNKCVNYETAEGEPITEVQVVQISYDLVVETGQFQFGPPGCLVVLEYDKTWMYFQAHFIMAHADLCECQETSRQGGYSSNGGVNNAIEIQQAFANMAQVTV